MAILRLCLAGLIAGLFLTGCATVRHSPIPASQVVLLETYHNIVVTIKPLDPSTPELPPNEQFHLNHYYQPDCIIVYHYKASQLTDHAQFVGQIKWDGVIPEMIVPESEITDYQFDPVFADLPNRVKEQIKEQAASMGANLVIVDIGGGSYYWLMAEGRLQPKYFFFGKCYYLPKPPVRPPSRRLPQVIV